MYMKAFDTLNEAQAYKENLHAGLQVNAIGLAETDGAGDTAAPAELTSVVQKRQIYIDDIAVNTKYLVVTGTAEEIAAWLALEV